MHHKSFGIVGTRSLGFFIRTFCRMFKEVLSLFVGEETEGRIARNELRGSVFFVTWFEMHGYSFEFLRDKNGFKG